MFSPFTRRRSRYSSSTTRSHAKNASSRNVRRGNKTELENLGAVPFKQGKQCVLDPLCQDELFAKPAKPWALDTLQPGTSASLAAEKQQARRRRNADRLTLQWALFMVPTTESYKYHGSGDNELVKEPVISESLHDAEVQLAAAAKEAEVAAEAAAAAAAEGAAAAAAVAAAAAAAAAALSQPEGPSSSQRQHRRTGSGGSLPREARLVKAAAVGGRRNAEQEKLPPALLRLSLAEAAAAVAVAAQRLLRNLYENFCGWCQWPYRGAPQGRG